jgi:hypothetical protein
MQLLGFRRFRTDAPLAGIALTLCAAACSSAGSPGGESEDAASHDTSTVSREAAAEGASSSDAPEEAGEADAPEEASEGGACRPKFASGLNVAWINFANDVPNPNLAAFDQLFQNTFNAGGRVVRWWFHVNGTSTPGYEAATATNPGQTLPITSEIISGVKSILDTAYADHVMLNISLWSFDMLQGTEDIPADTLANNLALLTVDANRQAYIDNFLTPLVTALKGYHGLYSWEIFNEAEGMTTQFGFNQAGSDGGPGMRVDESVIQKCVNWFADAIHTSDPSALVTEGVWQFTANANVSSDAHSFKNYYSDAELLAAGGDGGTGGRPKGTLDYYEDHYYDNFTGSQVVSPFTHPASYWDLDKPVVIGEFWPIDTDGVASADLYTTLFTGGYSGAWAWQYENADDPGPDAATTWPAEMVPLETVFAAHPTAIECPGDPAHEGPDASSSCVTTLADLTDGGGQLLYGFDGASIAGWLSQMQDSADAGLVATLGDTLTDGHSCPGALTLAVPFTAYGSQENGSVQVSLGGVNWTGRTELHFWVKLATANFAGISGVQAYVQTDAYAQYTSQFVNASVLADGLWHEIVVDLVNPTDDSYTNADGGVLDLASVSGLGVQVTADTAAPAGGPAEPSTVTLSVDDIWVQ